MLDKTNDASMAAENWLMQFQTALTGNDGVLKPLFLAES